MGQRESQRGLELGAGVMEVSGPEHPGLVPARVTHLAESLTGLSSWACDLCSHMGAILRRRRTLLGLMLHCCPLEIFNAFRTSTLGFHSAPGPANYVAGPSP